MADIPPYRGEIPAMTLDARQFPSESMSHFPPAIMAYDKLPYCQL